MLRAYGTRIETVLGTASCIEELGGHFACGLHVAEVDYMLSHEFAQTAEDILWRRSKLGLRFNSNEAADLVRWLGGDEVEAIQRPARMKH
jgi:glycerol-3-phosphate dehydrogenase